MRAFGRWFVVIPLRLLRNPCVVLKGLKRSSRSIDYADRTRAELVSSYLNAKHDRY
jgi:hypothetical protein